MGDGYVGIYKPGSEGNQAKKTCQTSAISSKIKNGKSAKSSFSNEKIKNHKLWFSRVTLTTLISTRIEMYHGGSDSDCIWGSMPSFELPFTSKILILGENH